MAIKPPIGTGTGYAGRTAGNPHRCNQSVTRTDVAARTELPGVSGTSRTTTPSSGNR